MFRQFQENLPVFVCKFILKKKNIHGLLKLGNGVSFLIGHIAVILNYYFKHVSVISCSVVFDHGQV